MGHDNILIVRHWLSEMNARSVAAWKISNWKNSGNFPENFQKEFFPFGKISKWKYSRPEEPDSNP
jgi:hypothetical protein